MTCRHENEQLPIGRCASVSCVVFHTREVLRTRKLKKCGPVFCHWCGDYVPLGPSNDTDERVAVEIRAVQVAEAFTDHNNHDLLKETSFAERRGWWMHAKNSSARCGDWTPVTRGAIAGYLARCILDHDSATEREGRR